jgi:hypothetical protein
MVGIGIRSFGNARAEADASARRFLSLLGVGEYGRARLELSHFTELPSVEFLEFWRSECTHNVNNSTHVDLTNWVLKSNVIGSNSSARLTYSIDANGSTAPLFVTVEHLKGKWLVSNFNCPMTRTGIEKMKALML